MKTTHLIIAALLALVLTVSISNNGYAQTENPPKPRHGGMMGGGSGHMEGGMMNGTGSMNGNHMSGGHMNGGHPNGGHMSGGMPGGNGAIRTYMVKAFAEAIGISEADLQARMSAGESMWDIARSVGKTDAQILQAMNDAHAKALEQAVADGVITPEQAKWMNEHMSQMFGPGAGPAACHTTNGAPMMDMGRLPR